MLFVTVEVQILKMMSNATLTTTQVTFAAVGISRPSFRMYAVFLCCKTIISLIPYIVKAVLLFIKDKK